MINTNDLTIKEKNVIAEYISALELGTLIGSDAQHLIDLLDKLEVKITSSSVNSINNAIMENFEQVQIQTIMKEYYSGAY